MTTTFPGATLDDLANLLRHLSANSPRDEWVRVLAGAKAEFGDEARDLCRGWSAQSEKFSKGDFSATWRSIKACGGITIKTVAWLARQHGYAGRRGLVVPAIAKPAPIATAEDTARTQTDIELVRRIWSDSRMIDAGCPARLYLTCRGCRIPPADADLRFHRDLHLYGFAGPAMVGRIREILNKW